MRLAVSRIVVGVRACVEGKMITDLQKGKKRPASLPNNVQGWAHLVLPLLVGFYDLRGLEMRREASRISHSLVPANWLSKAA